MAYKLTMIFQATTEPQGSNAVPRTAGWSETVYSPTYSTSVLNSFRNLMIRRAALLPTNASIIGQRYQIVLPTGGSSTGAERFPGQVQPPSGQDTAGDIPSMCLLCKTLTAAANVRPTYIRGIPDAIVRGGEYFPQGTFGTDLQQYFVQLRGWSMLGRDLAAVPLPVASIGVDGLLAFFENQSITVPGRVRISSSMDENGLRRGGSFKAIAAPTPSTLTLLNWPYGATEGGTLKVQTPGLITMGLSSVARIVTKKVGRPFFQFRGRASKRR